MRDPPFYRTSWSKHLHSLVRSGFFARDLDADDHEFLEYVKVRGIANGSLPNTSIVSLEELEFWDLPYGEAPGVQRKAGPVPLRMRPAESPEQRAMRQARTSAWHARRIIRAEERAIAEAEMARERAEWEKANEKRKLQETISDAEWEAAAPRKPVPLRFAKKRVASFGKTVGRHYVPQWKVDEQLRRETIIHGFAFHSAERWKEVVSRLKQTFSGAHVAIAGTADAARQMHAAGVTTYFIGQAEDLPVEIQRVKNWADMKDVVAK